MVKLWDKTQTQLLYHASLNKDIGMKTILGKISKVKKHIKMYVIQQYVFRCKMRGIIAFM